ncbi:MAG: hypothetical protein AB7P40_25955, partial [Chloroflexota bacterium]
MASRLAHRQAAALPLGRPRALPIASSRADRRDRVAALLAAYWHELVAVCGLTLLTMLAEWPLLHGQVVAGLDSLTQFYPWYQLLGATLREGQLPGWNPYSFAGAPLAANPLTGWTYLPAMLAFTLLPLTPAIVAYQLAHALLATFGAYALARALGLRVGGAVLAAIAYGQSGLIAVESACCFAFASVGAWLPLLLLGTVLAGRSSRWRQRFRGWAVSALALSQIIAAWPGQGTYYAVLAFGAFVVFHGVVSGRSIRERWRRPLSTFGWLVANGTVPIVLGLGLAAAGLLPRAELQGLSSLAGGYAPEDLNVGGWTVSEWLQLVQPGYWYAGLIVAGLALMAPLLAEKRRIALFLTLMAAVLLLLALPTPNPVASVFGVLPGFTQLHPHLPDRIMTVFMIVPAILAGATLDRLVRGRLGLVVAVLLIAATFADLRLAREHAFLSYATVGSVHVLAPVAPESYYQSSPAATFLQQRMRIDGPFRYLGYGPAPNGLAYTQRFSDSETVSLGVNNRGVSDRLPDLQGYDAVHLARFDALLRTANGQEQNYHNADVFAAGLKSPLLDLLAARYIVTPAALTGTPADPALSDPSLITVYNDGETRILENTEALPWAWIVHGSRASMSAEALDLIQNGQVDPRATALLEPPLHSPLAFWEGSDAPSSVPTLLPSVGASTASSATVA